MWRFAHDHAAAQVKQVLALATGAGASALPIADMRERVLDGHALAQLGPSSGRLLARTQLGEEALVRMQPDAAPPGAGRTALAQRTGGGQAAQLVAGKWTPCRRPPACSLCFISSPSRCCAWSRSARPSWRRHCNVIRSRYNASLPDHDQPTDTLDLSDLADLHGRPNRQTPST